MNWPPVKLGLGNVTSTTRGLIRISTALIELDRYFKGGGGGKLVYT